MILTKEIEITLSSKNIKYYENLGYEIPRYYNKRKKTMCVKRGTKIKVIVKDLPIGSHIKVKVKCDYCGKEYDCKILKYYAHKSGINKKDCCNNCKSKKADETLMLKYGVNHNTQLDSVKNKLSENLRTEFNIINKSFEDKGLHIVKKYLNLYNKNYILHTTTRCHIDEFYKTYYCFKDFDIKDNYNLQYILKK